MSKTLKRSFGFPFREKMFGGTVLLLDNGQNDAYVFYDGKEYENLQAFFDEIKPIPAEHAYVLETLNKLLKSTTTP